jgi:hypothetical protein
MLLVGYGCENQDILPNAHESDERSQFANENEFEAYMNSVEIPDEVIGRKSTIITDSVLQEVPKELLQILDKDNLIEIGDWVMKLNFHSRRILVIESDNLKKLYKSLINEETHEDIYNFSMDNDVFALLEEGYTTDPETVVGDDNSKIAGIFCGGGTSSGSSFSGQVDAGFYEIPGNQYPVPIPTTVTLKIEAVNFYKKFGVWFELSSHGRVYENYRTGKVYTMQYDVDWIRKQTCRRGNERSGREIGSGNVYYDSTTPSYMRYKITVYNSSRGLKKLRISGTWKYYNSNTGTFYTASTLLNKGY